ncbi:phasin family protein [Rhodopila sp.]|uniref:phasin family protein n=1 Tax=Rhodopila sp. TaxID=2480087 RepID=UPI003D117063
MSETTKAAEAAKKATDHATRSSQATVETAGRSTKAAMRESNEIGQHAADRAMAASHSMTETVTETAKAAANMSSKAAEQGREAMMMGVRSAAGLGSRVADINFGRGHHLLASAANAMEVYRDASERSAERVQALFSSCMTFGRGLQDMQHAWLEMLDTSIENAAHKPQDMLRCNNMVELAEVQRDLYIDAINHAFESTSRLLQIAGRTAQDAVRPLQ